MMKRSVKYIFAAVAVASVALAGCKTSEANYRAAYDRAVAGRDSVDAVESTIYGAQRAMSSRVAVVAGDSLEIRPQRVAVTEGGGGIRENLKTYCVVVGQFKQRFNACSMRERLAEAGYADAFVVETAEPYYYVVLSSHADVAAAGKALRAIPADFPVRMKAPLPFILQSGR